MTNASVARGRRTAGELVSLSERHGYLRAMRFGMAVVVLGAGALAPRVRGAGLLTLATVSGVYLLLAAAPDFTRHLPRTHLLPVIGATLLVDGVYLAWVMYATGGMASPLRFLVYLHIVAVTLLGSYRTGLKIAAWHSLLFFVAFYAQSAGLIAVKETLVSALPGRGADFRLVSMLNVAGLWAVALATAAFSAVNEREVRRQKIDLEQLSATVAQIDQRAAAWEIPRILLDSLCEVFAFSRGAVLASPVSDDLSLMAYRGYDDTPEIPSGLDPVMEQAWNRRQTMLLRRFESEHDPRLAALFPDGRNLLIVPLFIQGGYRLGLVVLEQAEEKDHIRRWVVTMVEQFASHAALAIHNAWLLDEVQGTLQENRGLQAQLMSQNLVLELKVQERTHELSESLQNLRMVDEQRRRLLSRLVNAEEEERQRIADGIHDGPVQQIVTAGMRLDQLRRRLTDPSQLMTVDVVSGSVREAVDSLRNMLFDLRPVTLDQEGLEPALRQFLANLDGEFEVRLDNRLRRDPSGETRIIVYRIAQEALANVRKHARATSVNILLEERDGRFLTRIQDDGAGFSPPEMLQSSPGHLGLSSMRERAEMAGGSCTVRSFPGGGTTVEFWVADAHASPNGSGRLEDGRSASLVLP